MLRVKHESANGRSIIDVLDIGDTYQFEDLMEVDGSLTMDRSTRQTVRASCQFLGHSKGNRL